MRKTLGARVVVARKQVGLTQRGLARALGRSPSWAREVESGAQYAPAYLLVALAEATGWGVGWFYGGGLQREAEEAQMAYTNEEEARISACVKFMVKHPNLPTCGLAWRMAFQAGMAFVRGDPSCGTCGGLRRVEVPDHGWCRCPGCCPITHLTAPDDGTSYCGRRAEGEGQVDDVGSASCPDCLHQKIRELEAKTA